LAFWYAALLLTHDMIELGTASLGFNVEFVLFDYSIMLEPLNTFLYTWTFLETLAGEKQGNAKRNCNIFR